MVLVLGVGKADQGEELASLKGVELILLFSTLFPTFSSFRSGTLQAWSSSGMRSSQSIIEMQMVCTWDNWNNWRPLDFINWIRFVFSQSVNNKSISS